MKPAPFMYRAPDDVAEATSVLAQLGDEAKVLAGGQSLLPLLNLRLAKPSALVDVSRIAELWSTHRGTDGCSYGAGIPHSRFEDGDVPDPTGGLLRAAAAGIGYRAVRNRGTLGGSLCHADSSAEWPVVMAALGAEFVVRSVRGQRTIAAGEFARGFFTTDLVEDELLTSVRIPPQPANRRYGIHKTSRKPGEFAESLAVAVLDVDDDGRIEDADIWLGAAKDVPVRLDGPAAALRGSVVAALDGDEITTSVRDHLGAASSQVERYQAQLHAVTVWRAVDQLRERSVEEQ